MAVQEQTPYKEYKANGSTSSFSLGFLCESKDQLIVLVDDVAPSSSSWSFNGSSVVFNSPPASGKRIAIQRNTKLRRTGDFQNYDNSFRPDTINKELDWIWLKLQELGVADMLLKIYVDRLHLEQKDYTDNKDRLVKNIINDLRNYVNQQQGNLSDSINNLKTYVDQQDNNRNSYFENLIDQQGVSLLQLDNYYNHLMQQLAQIAVDKGWAASFIVDASGENQQEINDRFKSKLQGEFISVWDFFTKTEKQAYNRALINGTAATFDSHRQLQEFLDYIAANDVNTAYCSADLYVSKGVILGGASGCLTKNVMGRLKLSAIAGNPIDDLFKIQAGQNLKWYGLVNVVGVGGLIYNARTVKRGLVVGGQYASTHTWIQAARAEGGFIEYGILIDDYTTGSCIDDIRTTRCGSGHFKSNNSGSPNWSLNSTFTIQSENTSSGATQETVLTVSTLPPDWLYYNPMVVINEKLYHVKTIDSYNSRISIRPLLDRNDLDKTSLRYMFGAGVLVAGSDASVVRIGKYNATDNAIAMHSAALYAPIITALTAEANGIGLIIGGGSTSQAHVGGSIGSFYCENNIWDIVRRTNAQLSYSIATTNYEQDFSRFTNLAALRNSVTNVLTDTDGLNGVQVGYKGYSLNWESRTGGSNNTLKIDVTDIDRSEYWHYGSSKTFDIVAPNVPLNNVFGFNRKSCIVMGKNNAGNPTGDIIFNAPEGYTVNGGSSVTFNGFTKAAKFDVYLQYGRNNFVVVCLTLPPTIVLSASVTYDPELLAPNEIKYWNVTLNGAKLGDAVVCSFSRALNGTRIWAEVTGANIVTVYHQNPTANPVDLTSGTLSVKLV